MQTCTWKDTFSPIQVHVVHYVHLEHTYTSLIVGLHLGLINHSGHTTDLSH